MKPRTLPWEPREIFKQFCAATVTAVAAVAAAGTAAYSSYSQKKSTDAAQAGLAADPAGAYGTKVEPVRYKDNVSLPKYDASAGTQDYLNNLPMLSNISKSVTGVMAKERDKLTGGMASANLNQAGVDINSLLKGTVSPDVLGEVNRLVAERSGGAFSPSGQGGQVASADFARAIGKTSTDLMGEGLSFAPNWETLTDSFTYKPQQAAMDALSALRERYNVTDEQAQIQLAEDEANYRGQVNYNLMKAQPNPQLLGATNDSLKFAALGSQQNQNEANALMGTISSLGSLYSTVKGPSATTAPTVYNSSAAASAAAPYAGSISNVPGMGYVPTATRV